MSRVLVGMSGGVDSAVAALLLKKSGYDVIGITLRTWMSQTGEESRCCEMDDARRVCRDINIPYYPLNCASVFNKAVIEPFMNAYLAGKTPNPCIECNRYVKWDRMLYYAEVFGADYVATGHYADVVRLDNGRYTLKKALHAEKDQTYMLYKLSQDQLSKTLMPLGKFSKDNVRKIAEEANLHVANKNDSQEICFVTNGTYADYIREHSTRSIPGKGAFKDEQGNVLGAHNGIINYTVGQRKGLGVALGYPLYVKKINPETNDIILAKEESVYIRELRCRELNYLSIDPPPVGSEFDCYVKVRYRHAAQKATVKITDDDVAEIRFNMPVRISPPGQSAVFYDENDLVVGGGIIIN